MCHHTQVTSVPLVPGIMDRTYGDRAVAQWVSAAAEEVQTLMMWWWFMG